MKVMFLNYTLQNGTNTEVKVEHRSYNQYKIKLMEGIKSQMTEYDKEDLREEVENRLQEEYRL